jgi:hypothetical protein
LLLLLLVGRCYHVQQLAGRLQILLQQLLLLLWR